MISIIVPTYNERDNIRKLIPIISKYLKDYRHEIVLVDDNSQDGTARVAEELSGEYPVTILKRKGKLGLASAILHGFMHAKGDFLGVIDADLQHPPEYVPDLALSVMNGQDIAIGSRYARGGDIRGWGVFRSLVSRGAVFLSRPLTDVKDPMSGYFFLKRKVIEDIVFNPTGYKILLEILVKGSYDKVKEIPYSFRLRESGKSKLEAGEFYNYLKLLFHLYGFRLKNIFNTGRTTA